jgi:tetratricopeptide (TPR) repeat protein
MKDKGKKILLLLCVVFFGFCILFAAQKISSFDIWWHLKSGEWIWHNKAVPIVDPFSYTFQGAEWTDFEWLFQAVIYPIYQLGEFRGLIIFKIIVVLLTFTILFLTCRKMDEGKAWLSFTLLFIALLVARGRFTVRPQIIFLFFLTFYLYFFTLYQGKRITTRQLILFLVPAQFLWANFHSSFLMGILLVGIYALGRFFPLALSHHRDLKPVFQDEKLRSLLFLCLLLVLTSLLNPHTYRAFLIPFKTAGSEETLKGIAEWAPLNIRGLGLFIVDPTMWFRALFLLGAASFWISRRNLTRVENMVIFALFSYLAFKHIRFCGAFAVATVPIIVNNFSQLQWQMRGWKWIRLIPLLFIIAFSMNEVRTLIRVERLGLGVWNHYPEATVNFLKQHDVRGKIFNTYGHGGYIIWHLWPDIPVFIDGRTPTIYDQNFFWLYAMAERKEAVWEEVSKRYGVEIVLVRDDREKGYASLFHWLDKDENWRLVAFDDNSNLYMKQGTEFDGLIEKYGFHYFRPSDLSMNYAKERKGDERYLKTLEKELQEACQRFPHDFYPFYYLGVYHQIYGTKEHLRKAEKALLRSVANRPDSPRGYSELGFTLMKLERYGEAVKAFKHSISLSSSFPPNVYYYLGVSLFHKGKTDEAIKFLEEYKRRAHLETRVEAYKILGKAYMKKYKLKRALDCFERIGYLEEPTWETFLNMGVAYFGLDNLEKAQESFERAMEMRPDNLKVVYNLAVVYEKLGYSEKAKRLFQEVSQMTPQTSEEANWVQRAREKVQ